MTEIDLAAAGIQVISSGIGTVIGAVLGYRLAIYLHIRQKRHDFIVEQLRDFYAPMLAMRDEIRSGTDACYDLLNNYYHVDWFYRASGFRVD